MLSYMTKEVFMCYTCIMCVLMINNMLTYESIPLDHNGAWIVLLKGAISMVEKHNTNSYCHYYVLIYFLIIILNPILAFLLIIPLLKWCKAVCSKWQTMWNSTEGTFPAWDAYFIGLFPPCFTPNHASTTLCMSYSWCTQCMENNKLSQVCVWPVSLETKTRKQQV